MANRKRSTIIASSKSFERRVAKFLLGWRNPSTGARAEADAESKHYMLAVQCKVGYKFPTYLRSWLEGIRGFASKSPLVTELFALPIVVWTEWGKKTSESIVVARLDDLKRWMDERFETASSHAELRSELIRAEREIGRLKRELTLLSPSSNVLILQENISNSTTPMESGLNKKDDDGWPCNTKN